MRKNNDAKKRYRHLCGFYLTLGVKISPRSKRLVIKNTVVLAHIFLLTAPCNGWFQGTCIILELSMHDLWEHTVTSRHFWTRPWRQSLDFSIDLTRCSTLCIGENQKNWIPAALHGHMIVVGAPRTGQDLWAKSWSSEVIFPVFRFSISKQDCNIKKIGKFCYLYLQIFQVRKFKSQVGKYARSCTVSSQSDLPWCMGRQSL